MLPSQTKEVLLQLRTHYGFVKVYERVRVTGKTKSNYEEEKKNVEYRQTEYIMKVIIGGERL